MEVLIIIFTTLTIISGAALSFLGISGSLKNHRTLGLWILYLTILFAITWAFLYFQKHIWGAQAADAVLPAPKERPELYVSGTRMSPLVPGQPETVLLGIKNRGSGIARNIRLGGGNHFFVSSSFNGPLEYKAVAVDTRPDLGPGEEKSMVSRSFEPLSKERIKELQEGNLLFFHFAEGEYDGDDGTTHPIDYCFMYMPLTPTAMRICPEKYWPKERKDRRFPGRPELFIEQVMIEPLEAGRPEMISLVIRNKGKGTAHNVSIETTHAHKPPSFGGPLIYETVPADTRADVAPDAVITLISRSPWTTTPEHIRSISAGSRLLFVYGKGCYDDGLNNRYSINFCYMFEPSITSMVITPEKYRPQSRADKRRDPSLDGVPVASLKLEGSTTEGIRIPAMASPEDRTPHDGIKWTDYTEDYFDGAIWRWGYRPEMGDKEPRNIRGICPDCGAVLSKEMHSRKRDSEGLLKADFICHRHNPIKWFQFKATSNDPLEPIRVLIRQKLETGDWKDVVKRQADVREGRV